MSRPQYFGDADRLAETIGSLLESEVTLALPLGRGKVLWRGMTAAENAETSACIERMELKHAPSLKNKLYRALRCVAQPASSSNRIFKQRGESGSPRTKTATRNIILYEECRENFVVPEFAEREYPGPPAIRR